MLFLLDDLRVQQDDRKRCDLIQMERDRNIQTFIRNISSSTSPKNTPSVLTFLRYFSKEF